MQSIRKECSISRLTRYLIHIPHGLLAGIALVVRPVVGIGWLVLIISYQFLEDWKISDHSYLDMRGYMIGFVLGLLCLAVWWVIKRKMKGGGKDGSVE